MKMKNRELLKLSKCKILENDAGNTILGVMVGHDKHFRITNQWYPAAPLLRDRVDNVALPFLGRFSDKMTLWAVSTDV